MNRVLNVAAMVVSAVVFLMCGRLNAAKGVDVVDDCIENVYKIIFNVDHDGEVLDEKDAKALIGYIRGMITSEVSTRRGMLMQSGIVFGIVSSHS